ncbi:MAG TPA: DUF192 domain-containing protein [Bryobacteraceae bacterium]|nr:DUF192 domain-containing protein [Bryobacteraceae bacterium]
MWRILLLNAALLLASCGEKRSTILDLHSTDLTLPGGQVIHAQTMGTEWDRARGMAFHDSLAPDRGMLFLHETPGTYSYWMYQHYIPLDMIWMDDTRSIVEIVENAQPCKTVASECQHYGGTKNALYVLELAGGMAQKYHLRVGETITW